MPLTSGRDLWGQLRRQVEGETLAPLTIHMTRVTDVSPLQEGAMDAEGLHDKGAEHVQKTVPPTQPNAGGGSVRWYERAYDYWEDGHNCPLDDDGVLGGYGHISPIDIAGSAAFLDDLKSMRPLLGDDKAAGDAIRVGALLRTAR